MATAEQIKQVILQVAGYPDTGVAKELAEKWAEAIVAIDNPKPEVENRVINAVETR
jgi:hypothetical protein